jgi:hypothetical protein
MTSQQFGNLRVDVVTFGPSQATINTLSRQLLQHAALRPYLAGTEHQLLSLELLDPEAQAKSSEPQPPNRYRATIYDYTHNRTLVALGALNNPAVLEILESNQQPLPNQTEFGTAVQKLQQTEMGTAISENSVRIYRPMPPLIETELPDGQIERTLTVGLLHQDPKHQHEIVGVNLIDGAITRFETGAPDHSRATEHVCGAPNDANQSTADKGTPGQVIVTVTQGSTVLWKFHAIRPAASSGTNGSGIELRYVDYRGKRVLHRAHVPILNVRYDQDLCGPYRDWQYEEGMIRAQGTDVAPGFRLCPTPAKTLLDTGSDTGNFLGVAIYVEGQEVVLVSEMEAGWYRYVSEWRLHVDGTIRPRFGFTAVNDSCVCNRHHHHVYWRFDFDIRTVGDNLVEEHNDPPLFPPSKWHPIKYEVRRQRSTQQKRRWRITNATTGEGYALIPGKQDGKADSFGVGDVWILRYRPNEIDDGQGFTTDPAEARANLDKFLNRELIDRRDVVIWYAAHFTHDLASEEEEHGHILGPELKPLRW